MTEPAPVSLSTYQFPWAMYASEKVPGRGIGARVSIQFRRRFSAVTVSARVCDCIATAAAGM